MRVEMLCRAPIGASRPTPLLFVHGAWHGAWCWEEHFLDWFAARGWESFAVDLRGHGASLLSQSMRTVHIADYVDDVLAAIEQIGVEPVVVGHSMGGLIVGRALARRRLPGAVLVAPVPVGGPWRATARVVRRHPRAFLAAVGTLRMWPLVSNGTRARSLFFSDDLPSAAAERYVRRLQDESFTAYLEMLTTHRLPPDPAPCPTLVVAAGADALFSVAEQRRTATALSADLVTVDRAGHDLMLDPRWEEAATAIASWVEDLPR